MLTLFGGKCLSIFMINLSLVLEIAFVSNEHDLYLLISMVAKLSEPSIEVFESLPSCDVIN